MPHSPRQPGTAGMSRRSLLTSALSVAAAGPLLSACAGASTNGGDGSGVTFLSTQFEPVEERKRFESVLKKSGAKATYNPVEANVFASTLHSQSRAGDMQVSVAGGLHGDLAPIADLFVDLDEPLKAELTKLGIPQDMLKLAKLGGDSAKYIPWMQASYVLCINKKALEWLPSGADVEKLTYDEFLDWADAANQANGKPVFGFPGGAEGLFHRFFQGYLLPSFTGGQMTTFRNGDAKTAWTYMKDLWKNCADGSTKYEFMQEPLASDEVMVAWDHVARLMEAPKDKPEDWMMVPSPIGPKGLGYMQIIAGLSIPYGAPSSKKAENVVKSLLKFDTQVEVLKKNAFFPVVKGKLPEDLPKGIAMASEAIHAQSDSKDAIAALSPVGLGERDGDVTKIFQDTFKKICIDGESIGGVLDDQGDELQQILKDNRVPCWKPDSGSKDAEYCEVK